MPLFNRKDDPVSGRARQLNQQIAQLEEQIKRLHASIEKTPPPKLRSTAFPPGAHAVHPVAPESSSPSRPEIIFEPVDQGRLKHEPEPELFRDTAHSGAPRLDLPALWQKIRRHLHPGSTANPKLLKYLAAGNIQGLKPLRYEKRIARRRFFLISGIAILVFWILFELVRH